MSSQKLVVSELLTFLQHQLDVMDEVSIMQICTSNFSEEEIRSAKALLFTSLDKADRMPSRRRDEKGERSLQDMIRVFKETDPDDVPTFVAKELRKLPPVTFDHVDVTRLLKDITTLKASLAEVKFKLEASQNTISDLRTEVVDLRNIVSVCRSHESANVNIRRGAFNASQLSVESAVSELSPAPATISASDAQHRPARPASPVSGTQKNVSTSTPRAYAAAVASEPPNKQQRQQATTEAAKRIKPLAPSRGQADQEGFIKVEKKKKRKPTCRNQCGSALTGPNMLLRPEVPSTQLYVSRLHHSTKVEEIVEYIRVKTKWNLRVQKLESRYNSSFNSFVVRVPTHSLETFLKEEFWPKGVMYRRFRGRLRNTAQRNTCRLNNV